MTVKEAQDAFKAQIKTKLKGRVKASHKWTLDWPGCTNSGAEVSIISPSKYDTRKLWIVSCPASWSKKRPYLKKDSRLVRGQFGEERLWFFCDSKARAIQKMITVGKPIFESIAKDRTLRKELAKARERNDENEIWRILNELR